MTFATHDIILPRGTDIVTCHKRDLTHGNKNIFAKNKNKKIKKPESDT